MDFSNIDFAVWVALFTSASSVFITIINAILSYKTVKTNNDYLLKKAKIESEALFKSKINEQMIHKITESVNQLNECIINLSDSIASSHKRLNIAFFNAYSVASDTTREKLDLLKNELDAKSYINISDLRNSNLSSALKDVNNSFYNDIINLSK